jgi:hypothetical protein
MMYGDNERARGGDRRFAKLKVSQPKPPRTMSTPTKRGRKVDLKIR